MAEKRYYWLKLKEDYFNNPKIKKLRKIAGGDTYTIIYLKMQLLSIKNGGIIEYEGIEPTFEEELALKLDEDIDNVSVTLNYLQLQSLVDANNNEFMLIEATNNIGSEGQSAERVRRFREREQKALRSNDCVTPVLQNSISISNSISNNNINIEEKEKKSKRFVPPTLEEIQTYIDERHSPVDAQQFYDYFNTGNWVDSNGNKVKNWKQKLLTWEKFAKDKTKNKDNFFDILDSIQ